MSSQTKIFENKALIPPGEPNITRSTAWLAWSGLIAIANGILLWAAMAHWRDAAEVGQFSTIMSVYSIFLTLCPLGLSSYLAGEIARRRERRSFVASAILVVSAWSFVSAAAMVVAGLAVIQSPATRLAILILSLSMLPTGLISVSEAVFIGLGRARVIALATTCENLLRSVIPLFLLYRGHSLPVICFSFAALRLAACLAYAFAVRRRWRDLRLVSRFLAMEIVKSAPTFAGVTIMAAVHWQIGTVLVGWLGGAAEAAEFGVASRFLIPVTLLLSSYVNVLQPVASRLAGESPAQLSEFLSRSLRVVIALGLPLAVGSWVCGRELLAFLFGAHYAEASVSLGFLSLSIIPFSVVMVAARGLVATGRQRMDLLGNIAAVASNIACNVALIPRYGAAGAAFAQLLSVTVMAAVEAGYGARERFCLRIWQAIWICRWPVLGMSAVLWQTQRLGLGWALVLGGAGYLIGLALIRDRIFPASGGELKADASKERERPRVLMVGGHPTKTQGGISTMISEILHSRLAAEFEFRHVASQADQYDVLGKLGLAVFSFIKFGMLLASWRPRVAYVHVGGNASLYRKVPFIALARLTGRRVVTHFHAGDFDFYYSRQNRLGRAFIRRGLNLSHQLIAVSHCLGHRLHQLLPGARVSVVPNGVKLDIFTGEQNIADRHVRLLFVGAMGKLKGECDLIAALQRVPDLENSLRVVLLGRGAESNLTYFQTSSVWPLIEFLGPVSLEERVKFFKQADLFVLPSYAEGMPVSVIEAMASGLPVISTSVGGIPELIEDGVEGYLIAPGDIEALADRISRLISNPSERRGMGERGRAKARLFDERLILAQLGLQLRLATEQAR